MTRSKRKKKPRVPRVKTKTRVQVSPRFKKSLEKLDQRVKDLAKDALKTLLKDSGSRSLHLEPVTGRSGYWTIRVNDNFRILLRREEDADGAYYVAADVGNHDIYRRR